MSQDPEEAGVDWGYTGYGTGDPNATGLLSKIGKWMPYIVAGIFTVGTLQSMGLIPGMSAEEATAADSAIAAGDIPAAGSEGLIPGVTLPAGGPAAIPAAVGGAGGDAAAKAASDTAAKKALSGMGLTPGQIAAIIATLGGDAIAGLTTPRPQYRQSFAGTDMDPTKLGSSIKGMLDTYMGETQDRAHSDSTIDTTVNPLPAMMGGGLPMTIAAPGMDQRRIQRRTLPTGGPTLSRDPSQPAAPGIKIPVPSMMGPQTNTGINGGQPNIIRDGPGADGSPITLSPTGGGGGSDSDQALAALQLIMRKQA